MKKSLLVSACGLLLLAGFVSCGKKNQMVTTGGSPWLCSDIKQNITKNQVVSEKDNFHLAMNHDWLLATEIPEGKPRMTAFSEAEQEVDKKALAVLNDDNLKGHDADLAHALYHSILDWDARNKAALEPIMTTVKEIQNIQSISEFSDFICDYERSVLVKKFVSIGNTASFTDSARYVTGIAPSDFLLGDAAEYKKRTALGDRAYTSALHASEKMFARLGYSKKQVQDMLESVISFEEKLSEHAFTTADIHSPDFVQKANNLYEPAALADLSPVFPLVRLIASRKYDNAKQFLVIQPEYIKTLNELYTEENLSAMKNNLLINYVVGTAPMLDRKSYEISVDMKNEVNGITGIEPDEKVAYDTVSSMLTVPMNRAYLSRYDLSELKKQITEICQEAIKEYRIMLSETPWLSKATRDKAIEKLDAIRINAVYPEKWLDYSSLDLAGLSYFDCVKKISAYEEELDRSHTNGMVDKEIMEDNLLVPNAFYDPSGNSINIIPGLLAYPFYFDGMSREELLGGIGCVIGHEISHAFDTNGAQFDKDGSLNDWWTKEDYEAFQKRADKLVSYYNSITLWEGLSLQGKNVQTEAIADMAGVKVMLRLAEKENGFDYPKFFAAYARVWHALCTPQIEEYIALQNEHPVNCMRTNITLQQYEKFYETYGIREGDGMYLAPENRVAVW